MCVLCVVSTEEHFQFDSSTFTSKLEYELCIQSVQLHSCASDVGTASRVAYVCIALLSVPCHQVWA